MSTETILTDKIKTLPQPLQVQVLDYIEFLLQKYDLYIIEEDVLSEEEMAQLEHRAEEYQTGASSALDADTVVSKLLTRYAQ